jgi:hypothetical protein
MSQQKPKFITCNYTNLNGTRLNGRLNRDQVYMYSLRGIAECGECIVNYTCPYNMEFVDPFLANHAITNVRNVDFDLTKSPYHARIEAIKTLKPFYYQDGSWANRCVEIMWGKFLWLEENLHQLADDDYLYWIDAGLSQGCTTPRRFCTFHNDKRYYKVDQPDEMELEYAHRHDRIYNDDFARRLEKYTGDKILLITCSMSQHGDPLGFEFYNHKKMYPIGGLFGGQKKVLIPFINRFKELAERVLSHDLLVKEEQLMAVIYSEKPEWFKTFEFDVWYHEDWIPIAPGVYNYSMRSFSDFFDEVLKL